MGILCFLWLFPLGDGALLVDCRADSKRAGATIDGELGSTAGKWIGALLGFLVLGIVGAILGAIAWYTRPNAQIYEHHEYHE